MPFRSVSLADATHDQLVEVLKRKPSRVRSADGGPEFVLVECEEVESGCSPQPSVPEALPAEDEPECDT